LSSISQALETGADEYVMKPFNREVLYEKLALLGLD
jgi:DNA-binding response OmpR family regulator